MVVNVCRRQDISNRLGRNTTTNRKNILNRTKTNRYGDKYREDKRNDNDELEK